MVMDTFMLTVLCVYFSTKKVHKFMKRIVEDFVDSTCSWIEIKKSENVYVKSYIPYWYKIVL